MRQKIALFSVNELKDTVEFAKILITKGWVIVATEPSCKLLRQKGVSVIPVEAFVESTKEYKFPATLHPKIEAALTDDDFPERIELVYDITYGPQDGLDVGGNTLLALAVKGRRIPVTSHKAMKATIEAIAKYGEISTKMREALIFEATKKIADYYICIAESVAQQKLKYLKSEWRYDLQNGENPYQSAALWSLEDKEDKDRLASLNYRLISDNQPCYTNMADLNSIVETLVKLSLAFRQHYKRQPYITIAAKHGNACGIGVDWESEEVSIKKALWGNPQAIWGGEVIVNFKLNLSLASLLVSSQRRKKVLGKGRWMLDIICAPEIDEKAHSFLSIRKRTKLFVNKSLFSPALPHQARSYRFIRGGIIKQSNADYVLDTRSLSWNMPFSKRENLDDLLIAWVAAFTSFHGGNEVALSRRGQLLSCAGGPSTVEAALTAVLRAKKIHGNLKGSSFAADAFFPFIDAPVILVNCGVTCGIVPSGGREEDRIKDFFGKKNIRIGFIPSEFRGFCRH